MTTRIPFTVIGGYLGAGKTTLLNHIVRHSDGRRLALLVNDFGSINIDAELINNQNGDTINLANGCVCCSMAGGFVSAIFSLLERDPRPHHIIVEASGVAEPQKIAQYGNLPQLNLDGVIVMADAEMIREKAVDRYVGRTVIQQLQSADVLILNKIDLVDEANRSAVRHWLAQQIPNTRIIEAQNADVPVSVLLGTGQRANHEAKDALVEESHDSQYETWDYSLDAPLNRGQFQAFVTHLPDRVLRAKGILCLADSMDQRTIYQQVGKRWSLSKGGDWKGMTPQSQIVVIGLKGAIQASDLETMILRCVS